MDIFVTIRGNVDYTDFGDTLWTGIFFWKYNNSLQEHFFT